MSMFTKQLGIDMGTSNTRIYKTGGGVILNEPTVAALSLEDDRVLAVGAEALEMIGRTPEAIRAYRPIKNGVIADFKITRQMLRIYLNKSLGRLRMHLPEVMLAISAGATSTEQKAAIDVATAAGIKQIHTIKSAVAASLGAGIPIAEPRGHLIIDIGGGSTEIALISLSGIVSSSSIRVGGDDINHRIASYLHKTYNLSIGEQTTEDIKHKIGFAMPLEKDKKVKVNGRDQIGGLPKTIEISSSEITPLIEEVAEKIVRALRNVIESTPPELVSDIMEHGIVIAGGTSQLRNLDQLLRKVIGVPVVIAQDPELVVVKGTGMALDNLSDYKKSQFGWD